MARNVSLQVLRGTQGNIPALSLGEMFFATDTNNLFFGTPGFGVGYIQIGDTTKVNETLQQIAMLLEAIRRALTVIACEGGLNTPADFDVAVIAQEMPTPDNNMN
jgi:hypothetical protein